MLRFKPSIAELKTRKEFSCPENRSRVLLLSHLYLQRPQLSPALITFVVTTVYSQLTFARCFVQEKSKHHELMDDLERKIINAKCELKMANDLARQLTSDNSEAIDRSV